MPQELIERVIYAATRGSSSGNSQEWDFIVVRNPETKQKIRDLLAPRFKAAMGVRTPMTGRVISRMIAGAMHLAETLNDVPAIIFVCGPVAYPPARTPLMPIGYPRDKFRPVQRKRIRSTAIYDGW